MIIRRQSLPGGLIIVLFAIALSAPLYAQNRGQRESLALNLSNEVQSAWAVMQDASWSIDKYSRWQQLYWAVGDFYNMAIQFAQEIQDRQGQPAMLRNQVLVLVDEASRIDDLMFKADTPEPVLWEWKRVHDSVASLAAVYKIPKRKLQ